MLSLIHPFPCKWVGRGRLENLERRGERGVHLCTELGRGPKEGKGEILGR